MQTQTHNPAPNGTAIEMASDAALERVAETRRQMVQVTPAVDIFENAEEVLLRADLPGIARDAVELRVERGVLSLVATNLELRRVYRRAFALSDVVDASEVDATLKDGVLAIRLRRREDMKPRRIEVRSAD